MHHKMKITKSNSVSSGEILKSFVMPIVSMKNKMFVCHGTGFVVNKTGLMMTAAHVLHDILDASDGSRDLYAIYTASDKYFSRTNLISRLLLIEKAWCDDKSDIGFCRLREQTTDGPTNKVKFNYAHLTISAPPVGMGIIGCGFHSMNRSSSLVPVNGNFVFNFNHRFAITTGEVREIYPFKRDSVIQKYPCFLNNARFEIGMSGGPVFNSDGYVCGVVSSGISPDNVEEKNYTEYSGLLWPTLGNEIEIWLDSGAEQIITIYELAKNGWFHFDDSLQYYRWDPLHGDGDVEIELEKLNLDV